MDWSVGRRRRGLPPKRPLYLSLGLHAAVIAVLVVSSVFAPDLPVFETYQITLVSPPSELEDAPPAPPEELVVETPEPEPEPPEETPPPPEPEVQKPEPAPPEPERPVEEKPEPKPRTPPAEPKPTPTTPPEPTAEPAAETGADINVRLEGLKRDYPEYWNRIITEIRRCFRPPSSGRGTTVVQFTIQSDGTVSEARLVQRSGNAQLDYLALGSITDCAGKGRFGPLPEDYPYERLPVQFEFSPRGFGGGASLP